MYFTRSRRCGEPLFCALGQGGVRSLWQEEYRAPPDLGGNDPGAKIALNQA
jgi:hypothetical protein